MRYLCQGFEYLKTSIENKKNLKLTIFAYNFIASFN